ncbi:MAG: DNA polymerase A family protein, partial [Nanoarchaeota archaeon]
VDFSQIELRLLAHFSNDSTMLKAYNEGIDLHALTAKYIFAVNDPSKEQRFLSKQINFACLYGAYPKKIMEVINTSNTGITVSFLDANNILNRFNELYREADIWKKIELGRVRLTNRVYTLGGRIIPIEGLSSGDFGKRAGAERAVISYIIQGSAADVMKKSMIDLTNKYPYLQIVASIHDELLIEVHEDTDLLIGDIPIIMEKSYNLKVPLVVDVKIVSNWSEK